MFHFCVIDTYIDACKKLRVFRFVCVFNNKKQTQAHICSNIQITGKARHNTSKHVNVFHPNRCVCVCACLCSNITFPQITHAFNTLWRIHSFRCVVHNLRPPRTHTINCILPLHLDRIVTKQTTCKTSPLNTDFTMQFLHNLVDFICLNVITVGAL